MSASSVRRSTSVTRRGILIHGAMAVACLAAYRGLAQAQPSDAGFVEAKTTRGRVRGARSNGLATFKGIPYAGAVSGANRFKAAPPLQAWTGVRDALQLAPPAPPAGRPASTREPAPAEDCLFLNVWTRRPMGASGPSCSTATGVASRPGRDSIQVQSRRTERRVEDGGVGLLRASGEPAGSPAGRRRQKRIRGCAGWGRHDGDLRS
jgi:hypothetical protein